MSLCVVAWRPPPPPSLSRASVLAHLIYFFFFCSPLAPFRSVAGSLVRKGKHPSICRHAAEVRHAIPGFVASGLQRTVSTRWQGSNGPRLHHRRLQEQGCDADGGHERCWKVRWCVLCAVAWLRFDLVRLFLGLVRKQYTNWISCICVIDVDDTCRVICSSVACVLW